MSDSAVRLLYVTAGSHDEAVRLGRTLVAERLAACANVFAPMTSIYEWKDEVHVDPEHALVVKTRAELVPQATSRLVELHSYDCPCVVALPVEGGHGPFLSWIAQQTG